ncbi:uncharacterized protein [Nicotiana tomentosiformis]|uniref:uncharacterized protein n=1 Tax=Nicotiana tomentosiformis TaxID=4098 RepID=UPI00388C5EA9
MARIRVTESAEQTPAHTARAARVRGRGKSRGRGRGRACVATRAPVRVTFEKSPEASVGGQVLEAPIVTPGLQETLAQFLNMFDTLTQSGLISVSPDISQIGGGAQTPTARTQEQQSGLIYVSPNISQIEGGSQTPTARTLEQQVHIGLVRGVVPVQPVILVQPELSGAAYQWWKVHEEGRPDDAIPPTWAQFSEICLKAFVPQTLRDAWHTEFERLCQGTMTVSEYAIRFGEFSLYVPILVPTVRERVRRFIVGLDYDFKICMAQELQTDIPF